MKRLSLLAALVVMWATSGCSSSSTSTPPTPAPQAIYVSSFTSPGELAKVALPMTASSSVTYLTPTGLVNSISLRFDHAGNLWSGNDFTTGVATGYAAPITNASTPFATINIVGAMNPEAVAFDAAGNLWVADGGAGKVYEFTPPFSGSITPAPALTISSIAAPTGLAFDSAGNLYISSESTGTIQIFNPPFAAATASPITGLSSPKGLAFDATGNLYIADFSGKVSRMNAPTAGGGAISIVDTATGITSPEDVAVDSAGNVYVTDLQFATVSMFPTATSPFSATLAPSVVLTLSGFPAGVHAGGVAVGAP